MNDMTKIEDDIARRSVHVMLNKATILRLEEVARESGRSVADLATSAVEEYTLQVFRTRPTDPGAEDRGRTGKKTKA